MTFDLAHVRALLPGREIDWFDTIDSTMIGSAHTGRIVGAEEQTAGRGRHGRSWHSPRGTGLYVSMALELPIATPVVTLALGLATRAAIAKTTRLTPDLRWPNDVLLRGRKCAGILAQLEGDAIVAGIGINVSQSEFPEGLDTPATSLLLEGVAVSREDLLVALVHAVDDCCRILSEEGPDAIMRQFAQASSYASGRRVRAEAAGRNIEGVTRGLNPSGFLIVREDNGAETTILAGGVRPI
jgi:BirA family biotin operon repressor/biotin-[acetyl-CoA-carboxylase] ligase